MPLRTDIPIPDLSFDEDISLLVTISSVRRRYQQGRALIEAIARNHTGVVTLKFSEEVLNGRADLGPGLWRIAGRLEAMFEKPQVRVTECSPITLEHYREEMRHEPLVPRAFTLDIETLTLMDFRERVGPQLERNLRLGNMRWEQQQRYLDDIAAEEERCYQLGSLSATSGRILSIAVHVGGIPGFQLEGLELQESECVFGIDADGREEGERELLQKFLQLMTDFDAEIDELVGHNIVSFDLPFIFQRCLVHCLRARAFVNPVDFGSRGIFDTMHHWWLGDRRGRVSLDDLAWVLGIESSKSAEVEGSKVFDLYQQGRLNDIREYNLRDVRVTRKIYERMIDCSGE